MIEQFLQIVNAGGDVGVWVLVYMFHTIDKRITVLEHKVA